MRRFLLFASACLFAATPALSCVGKSLLVGTDSTPESRVTAQILSILINERTGTTVEIQDFPDHAALVKQMAQGESEGTVDLTLEYAGRALRESGKPVPSDPAAALEAVKTLYMEERNLVWLTPLGFAEPGVPGSLAASVAQKHALKKFPALARLIAKTRDILTPPVVKQLAGAQNPAAAARDFLKQAKLI